MAVHKMLVCLFVVLISDFFQKLIEDIVGVAIGDDDAISQAKQISNAALIDWIFSFALLFQKEMKVNCWLDNGTNRKVIS